MTHTDALPRHFTCIDAMRGIAAIFVVMFHATRFFQDQAGVHVVPVAPEDMPYGAWLWPAFVYGEEAVRLFWVISGFVFAHVYWNRPTTAREFAVARFARLYPLHFVTLILVAGMQMISLQTQGHWQITGNNDLKHFVLQLFLLDSSLALSDGVSFNAPIWSVSAEIFVYVLFFLCLPLTRRAPLKGSLILAMLCYGVLVIRPDGFLIGPWVFACGVFFFAGAACYAGYVGLRGAVRPLAVSVAGLIGATVIAGLLGLHDVALLVGCCAIVMALAAMERSVQARRGVRGGMLQFLGDISYSLYLVHMPIQILVVLIIDLYFGGGRDFAASYLTLPLFIAGSIWVAYLTNRYFEKPVGAWLRGKMQKRRTPVGGDVKGVSVGT
ncbi:acyltransferase family protein [Pseudooctadecabacter jejudonensis]|nr:acyltransferase [Pseudooctadecabacter jejudonensis]